MKNGASDDTQIAFCIAEEESSVRDDEEICERNPNRWGRYTELCGSTTL